MNFTNVEYKFDLYILISGMQDELDPTLEYTALRECQEELGIDPSFVKIWGPGNTLISRHETSVMPVVGEIKGKLDLSRLRVNPKEVEEVFCVSLEDLCNPKLIRHTQFRGAFSAPVFLGGQRRIWGLTGIITNVFLQCLLPREVYKHKVNYVPNVSIKSKNYGKHI